MLSGTNLNIELSSHGWREDNSHHLYHREGVNSFTTLKNAVADIVSEHSDFDHPSMDQILK